MHSGSIACKSSGLRRSVRDIAREAVVPRHPAQLCSVKFRISWYDVVNSPHYPSPRGDLSDPDIETVAQTNRNQPVES